MFQSGPREKPNLSIVGQFKQANVLKVDVAPCGSLRSYQVILRKDEKLLPLIFDRPPTLPSPREVHAWG